jgi:tetratricopeptide (TPR) repeat protein
LVEQYEGLVDEKLLAKIEAKYGKFSILIVSSNKTLKNTFKRAFNALNFRMTNIAVADDFKEAQAVIKEHAPHIIVTNLYLKDDKTAIDLLKVHREYFPSTMKNFFIVTTEIDEHYISSMEHEYEFDSLLQGQFNFQEYVQSFANTLERKLSQSKAEILEARVKEALLKDEPDTALSYLSAADEADMDEYMKASLEADCYYKKNNHEEALKRYEKVLEHDSENFHALINAININYSDKNYSVAHDYCDKFLTHFSSPPKHLPVFLKVFIFNKEYLRIIKLCQEYDHDDRIDFHVKLNIAAALALCGKSLLDEDHDLAMEAFDRAISVSGGQSFNILQMVVTSLLTVSDLHDKAIKIMEKYRDNFMKMNQYIALEYDVLTHSRSAQENISEGMSLISKNVKSYRIYETLITSSVQTGRRKEVIEDLVFEACKEFPDYSEQFKRYI